MKLTKTNEVIEQGVSHNPEIKKKVYIQKEEIPHIMTFGKATFLPGQSVDEHMHETMYEVFYITAGKAIFEVNGKEIEAIVGDCITIEAGEAHSQRNPYKEEVSWLYFGVSVE